ncbi:MAG: SycD/LcrH family type III secretion system chaperone [Verrucomicrobia bacterium]|nr:SycD/LcrH family type III secretion system chaperone [Verrucomicrobiota bacterium]
MDIDFQKKIAEILNLSPEGVKPLSREEQNGLYATAFKLYNDGNYETAAELFTKLVLSAPFNHGFWKGLASSEQMKKEYTAALHAWCMVVLLNDKDPLPHFHAAECYLSQGNAEEANKALNAAEQLLDLETDEGKRLAEKINLLKTRTK